MTTVRLPAKASSAALARQRITADLAEREVATDIVEDVVLVVTELVSNAIRHAEPLADGQVTVSWRVDGHGVTIRVSDGGGANEPRVRHPSPRDTSGRRPRAGRGDRQPLGGRGLDHPDHRLGRTRELSFR